MRAQKYKYASGARAISQSRLHNLTKAFVLMAVAVAALTCSASDASRAAETVAPGNAAAARRAPAVPTAEAKLELTLAEQYCRVMQGIAAEAMAAQQAAELKALAKQIDERLAAMSERAKELKGWLDMRKNFSDQASAQVVNIFSAMKPEAASEKLVKMDEATSAAILGKLDARIASAILNDMPPEKAARLAAILTGAARKSDGGEKN